MKLFTSKEMKRIDAAAEKDYALPGLLLMENAGRAVANEAELFLEKQDGRKVMLFAGKGNNAGDSFAAARTLANKGWSVSVALVAEKREYKGDALLQLEILQKCGLPVLVLKSAMDWDRAFVEASLSDLLIDGLLGTGFHGELAPDFLRAADLINAVKTPVLAIDLPSGIDPDTGRAAHGAVKAELTVTMAAPKPGLYLYPGASFAGKVKVAEIGHPLRLLAAQAGKRELVTPALIKPRLRERPVNAHKGMAGRVVLFAGSPGFTGAAALASYAAVKTGAGLVTLLTPLSSQNVLAVKLTEVMVKGMIERTPGVLGSGAVNEMLSIAEACDASAIGPGLGVAEATKEVVREYLTKCEKPIVIDADALTALNGHTEILGKMRTVKVLTPHPAEMARLTGDTAESVDNERMAVAARYAAAWQAVIVLKGAPTVVALPDGSVWLNQTGNEGMASGGSGDVLTGVITALLGQGLAAADAAIVGVYLHGLAGDLAAADGKIGLAAGQLCEKLPQARKKAGE